MSRVRKLQLRLLAERIAHEKEMRKTNERVIEKARQIQFDEYERRLTTLNHAHEQAVEAQRATVPREVFDNYVKENRTAIDIALANVDAAADRRHEEVNRRLGIVEDANHAYVNQKAGQSGLVRWVAVVLGIIATALGILVILSPVASLLNK